MSIRIGIYPKNIAPTPPVVELVFDDIANADAIVGDSSNIADWNTAFGSPVTPFTSVVVVGNTVKLYGGADIAVPDSLFSTDIDDYGHLISITDTAGVITSAGYNSFGDYDVDSNGNILATAILPGLVTAGEGCFYNYSGSGQLVTIDFTALTTAGSSCFYSCTGLVNPDFSALTTAGNQCFQRCTGLVSPDFSALTTVGDACFYSCSGLVNPDFSALTTAGDWCFFNCPGLVNPNFSALTTAGNYYFYNCTGLVNPNFSVLTTAGDYCFQYCSGLVNPDFSALTTAGNQCFYNCTGLVNPDFSALTTAGDWCFYNCTSLTTISLPSLVAANTSLGTTSGDDNVFNGITGKTITLTVPAYFMTNNTGNPDGDIAYLQANNTVIVITV